MVCGNFRIETLPIFTDEECLIEALDKCSITYKKHASSIELVEDRVYGVPRGSVFNLENGRYVFTYDRTSYSSDRYREQVLKINMLARIEQEYNTALQGKKERLEKLRIEAENEKRRLEEERKRQIIDAKVEKIIKTAKSKGFYVKQTKNEEQIQLVLVRTSMNRGLSSFSSA